MVGAAAIQFRSLLLAAAMKAPNDPAQAAKAVWEVYYANHQKKGAFNDLKVADIFMGGGTTVVEGSRFGMQLFGVDLNPVAWFVVKQKLAQIDLDEVKQLLADIEAEVKPQIMPFYCCDGPNGEKGQWMHLPSGQVMGEDFDPLAVTGTPQARLSLLPAAQEHILAQEDGKARLLRAVTELSQAFALAVPHEEALRIRDDVGFFQAVRAVLAKSTPGERKTDEELDLAIRQIISRAVVSDEVVDLFAAAGLKKPDISILSDEFLSEVRDMPQRNLAVELLQKLLKGEIKTRGKRNVVQARSFAELLDRAVRKYQNRAIETAQVIEELIQLAKSIRTAGARGEQLGLSDDELAFYDALEANDSAVKVLGDDTLKTIARELVTTVRKNVTIDWVIRDNVRAQLRVYVKRILRKYGYPPDKQEKATRTVLEQAEVLSELWAVA